MHKRSVLKVEHLQSEFATGNSDRPRASHPALVGTGSLKADGRWAGCLLLSFSGLMQGRVENLDDLASDLNRIRDVHRVLEDLGDPSGERRFAVAGRAEEQQAPPGTHRGQQFAEIIFRNDEALEVAP